MTPMTPSHRATKGLSALLQDAVAKIPARMSEKVGRPSLGIQIGCLGASYPEVFFFNFDKNRVKLARARPTKQAAPEANGARES